MRASIQPFKALCIPEKSPQILSVRRSMLAFVVGRKQTVARHGADISFSLRNLPVRAFDSRAQGFSTPLARRRSRCPPPLPNLVRKPPNLVRKHPIERYRALRDSAPSLSRATTPPEGHQIGARKRRAPGNTMLSQPYRRRVSTDRLNHREGSQLAASLGGESGPTPAGNTLPYSYPETRLRRERSRHEILLHCNEHQKKLLCTCTV